jgi:hypothetical protein
MRVVGEEQRRRKRNPPAPEEESAHLPDDRRHEVQHGHQTGDDERDAEQKDGLSVEERKLSAHKCTPGQPPTATGCRARADIRWRAR